MAVAAEALEGDQVGRDAASSSLIATGTVGSPSWWNTSMGAASPPARSR